MHPSLETQANPTVRDAVRIGIRSDPVTLADCSGSNKPPPLTCSESLPSTDQASSRGLRTKAPSSVNWSLSLPHHGNIKSIEASDGYVPNPPEADLPVRVASSTANESVKNDEDDGNADAGLLIGVVSSTDPESVKKSQNHGYADAGLLVGVGSSTVSESLEKSQDHGKAPRQRYPCANEGCEASFAHREAWTTHQMFAHLSYNQWKCNLEHCHRVFDRHDVFEGHLRSHGIDALRIPSILRDCAAYSPPRDNYWCRFCCKFIAITDTNNIAHEFDHVEKHVRAIPWFMPPIKEGIEDCVAEAHEFEATDGHSIKSLKKHDSIDSIVSFNSSKDEIVTPGSNSKEDPSLDEDPSGSVGSVSRSPSP